VAFEGNGKAELVFSQTSAGATASARLYSLVETARANGIEPHSYLARLFAELPKAASADSNPSGRETSRSHARTSRDGCVARHLSQPFTIRN
jgi:hypothetical protein